MRLKYSDELLAETLVEIRRELIAHETKTGTFISFEVMAKINDIIMDLGTQITPEYANYPTGAYDKRVYEAIIKKDFKTIQEEIKRFLKGAK